VVFVDVAGDESSLVARALVAEEETVDEMKLTCDTEAVWRFRSDPTTDRMAFRRCRKAPPLLMMA